MPDSRVLACTHGPVATLTKASGRTASVTDWASKQKANGSTEVYAYAHIRSLEPLLSA